MRPLRRLRSPSAAARGLVDLAVSRGKRAAECALGELTRQGDYSAPITTGPDRTVLLFYEDIEGDRLVTYDRYLRRAARRVYHAVTDGQRVSGFEIAFGSLVRALKHVGCRVVVNNPALARRHPEHPIGIAGYPHVLERWNLPNPAVLGPGLLDHPAENPHLMQDPRFRSYIVPCEWMQRLFEPYYPEQCHIWFGGIDVDKWPDTLHHEKDIDVLVYDKLRWEREHFVTTVMEPVLEELKRRGLRTHVLVRGAYDHDEYRRLLGRSHSMLFLCEHETQGLAYQEAMACNVPILAWDQGHWLDPNRLRWSADPVAASSVPFFAPSCGERFASAAAFPTALDRLWGSLASYAPRDFVRDTLSLTRSAELYLQAYVAAAATPQSVSSRR